MRQIKTATTIKASSPAEDSGSALGRSAWKRQGSKGRRSEESRAQNSRKARPPTPPRRRTSCKHAPEKIAKKADVGSSHLKKHVDTLQAMPLVRSGLSDLLDGLAVLPPVETCA